LAFILLVNDLEKIVLAAIAIGVPLNLDVSLVISPYARTAENVARGYRTIVALTELRLSLATVMLVIGYALWIIGSRDSDRKPARFFAGTTIPALGLIFWSVVSVSQAQDWELASFRLVQLFELFLIYFYLANHLRTVEELNFFLVVSTWSMLAESVLMIVQWITGLEFEVAGLQALVIAGQVAGTFSDKGATAAYIVAQALITCAGVWAFRKRALQVLAAVSFVTSTVALVSTGSRIGWGAYAVTVPAFILLGLWRGLVKREALVGLFLIVLVIGVAFYKPIYARYTEDDRGSAESRSKMNRLAWNVIKGNMWLGVGPSNYALVAADYYTADVGELGYVIDSTVHNRYLGIWAETGLFGFLSYVAFFVSSIVQAFQYAVKSRSRFVSLVALGLACGTVSLCIQMWTATFIARSSTIFVWLLPALVASLHHLEDIEPGEETRVS
jgi:O-antigen ligase